MGYADVLHAVLQSLFMSGLFWWAPVFIIHPVLAMFEFVEVMHVGRRMFQQKHTQHMNNIIFFAWNLIMSDSGDYMLAPCSLGSC